MSYAIGRRCETIDDLHNICPYAIGAKVRA